jgi:hypothetical protein
MSRINNGPGGSHIVHARPQMPKALEVQYYQELDQQLQQRKAAKAPKPDRRGTPPERRAAIAADFRAGMSRAAVIRKWAVSRPVLDSIQGDMDVGLL